MVSVAKKYYPILLLVLLIMPSIWPLFLPGFFPSDDGEWMVIRFSAFYQAFADGQFPVRFLSRLNFGYGYPVANFLYPGFMYLGMPIKILGFGFTDSIKIILSVSMIFSGIFVFFWLRKLFDNLSSFVGAVFYIYAPYHLFDLYKRGSVGEVLALAVVPFILWQIERNSLFWSSFGIALLILSHNTLALMFLGLLILYMLLNIYVSKEKKKIVRIYSLMIIFGLGLSSFFWIPAIFELKYTVFSQTSISDPSQYFSSFNLIGVPTSLILALIIILFSTGKIQIGKHRLTGLMFALTVFSLFFAIEQSRILWGMLPVSFIQFPFRFLSLTILSVALLSAFVVYVIPKNYKIYLSLILIMIFFISAYPYLSYKQTTKDDSFYFTNEATTTVQDEYMPKWVKVKPSNHFEKKVEILKGDGEVKDLAYDNKKIDFTFSSQEAARVRINTIYYPGWEAIVSDEKKAISYDNEFGVMDVDLKQGTSKVILSFNETLPRLLADAASIFSFIALIIWTNKKTLFKKNK